MFYNIEVELLKRDGELELFIAHDGSSGCNYTFETKEELAELLKDYVEGIVDYEVNLDEIEEEDD